MYRWKKHGITIYTTYISVDPAHHEILRAKVGKNGIIANGGPWANIKINYTTLTNFRSFIPTFNLSKNIFGIVPSHIRVETILREHCNKLLASNRLVTQL